MDDAFEPVLSHHNRDAEIVHEARNRREHFFRSRRVERRRRLVEHQHARVRSQRSTDRRALELTSRELAQGAAAQVGDAEHVEDFFDALSHHGRLDRELFHHVCEFFFDSVGDTTRDRVLADETDDVGEIARMMVLSVATVD